MSHLQKFDSQDNTIVPIETTLDDRKFLPGPHIREGFNKKKMYFYPHFVDKRLVFSQPRNLLVCFSEQPLCSEGHLGYQQSNTNTKEAHLEKNCTGH